MTREQYMRRKRLRLARNWAVLILICAAIVAPVSYTHLTLPTKIAV